MTVTGDELRSHVELVFRQRHEEVLTCENVVVIGRSASSKGSKPRLLALCRPFASSSSLPSSSTSQTTLNVLRVKPGRAIKVKLVFVVTRLVDVSHDGSFDATFNFGGSGMISVAFESHIQREMFVSALRKVQRDLQPLVSIAPGDVRVLFTGALGAEVEADAAARVKSLRHEKRRALTAEDEQRLQQFLDRHSFDDIRGMERLLSTRQKEAELSSVEVLVASVDEWEVVRSRIADLVNEVVELEGRMTQYSKHILARKNQLQRIEHQNNTLQRKQQNLKKLHAHLETFCSQLSLPSQTTALLLRLRDMRDEELVDFFTEGNNAQVLSDAMKHMRGLLHNASLWTDYPVAAVAERRAFFTEQRQMIAHRSKAYIFATIGMYEKQYLADSTRLSDKGRLVWRTHSELMAKLVTVCDVITALAHIDVEGFIAVLRRYRVAMQRVYALEIHRFFKYLRAQVKKVGSRGPFLLGVRDSSKETFAGRVETTTSGGTPRRFVSGGAGSVASVQGTNCSPSLCEDLADRGGAEEGALCIDLPTPQDENLRLFDTTRLHAPSTPLLATLSVASVASEMTGAVDGKLRPDLAFAVALETTFGVVLQEEDILRRCFGLVEKRATSSTDDTDASPRSSNGAFLVSSERDVAEMLRESLLELFGGEKMLPLVSNGKDDPSRPPGSGPHSAENGTSLSDSERCLDGARQAQLRCYLLQQLVGFAQYCKERCDRLYAVPVMVMLKAYSREGTPTAASTFCQMLLQALERVVASTISQSVAEQTASIALCRKRYIVRPVGMLSCFTKLPAFVQRMEAAHNAMPPAVCSRSEYASITISFVDQSFEVLNYVTNLTNTEARKDIRLTPLEILAQRANRLLDGVDKNLIKRGIIQQYRHHAFFCSFYTSLSPTCYAVDLLRERYESSRTLRDRYEEVYLTRIILVKDFPEFGTFALVAEDLAQVHSREELRHHNALSVDAVRRVLRCLPREVHNGIPSISRRMKKHFLRDRKSVV